MDVKVASYWVPVAIDEDGTPLDHGERMVEVEPGHWMSPVLVAVLDMLKTSLEV